MGHIYFLTLKDEVVYIGQSLNVGTRVKRHISDREKEFDSYYTMECEDEMLEVIEAFFINHHKPKCNKYLQNRTLIDMCRIRIKELDRDPNFKIAKVKKKRHSIEIDEETMELIRLKVEETGLSQGVCVKNVVDSYMRLKGE